MNLASLCTREVVGIPAGATPREAAALMCEEHVGALVVVTPEDPPQVVGIVTDRDLALDVLGRDAAGTPAGIGALVRGRPLGVPGTASLRDAAVSMEQGGVRRLLVVDDDGGVIGIVSADDLLQAMADDLATLARSLRSGIAREAGERKVVTRPARPRAVYPAFGTVAMQ